MNILVINLGSQHEVFISTSLNKRFFSIFDKPRITWVCADKSCKDIFRYNRSVFKVVTFDEFLDKKIEEYECLYNLHPSYEYLNLVKAEEKVGFHFSQFSDKFTDILYNHKSSRMSLYNLYFRVCGFVWKGEGPDFSYFPKSRMKKGKIGLALSNSNLRKFVRKQINLGEKNFWYVPFKENFFKKYDEINKCAEVVTDDLLTLDIALFLRKKVYFLETFKIGPRIEFFSKGNKYKVPSKVLV